VFVGVAGVVVGKRHDVDAGEGEPGDVGRVGAEDHAGSGGFVLVGEGGFEVDEGEVGPGELGGDVAEWPGGVAFCGDDLADDTGEHDVTAEQEAVDWRGNLRRRLLFLTGCGRRASGEQEKAKREGGKPLHRGTK
jgi:hypothetical protein